ncbi:hypothetical protein IHQ68_00525 [Chelatococcus sambhunathii]|uniref:Immunity protein 8 n=1 Tax=Chelatococcus sambhunathii TaxID=363953 RepID=A0ABU1DAH3_9HYPH|nr:hypothetical protein [Chelatococcus sambhunathii]
MTSTDVDDLRSYAPGTNFCVAVTAIIGPRHSPGGEMFQFLVCSPSWLADELERNEVICPQTYMFMASFNYAALERFVLKRIAHATGETWREIATKLARWSDWEFEGYVAARPGPSSDGATGVGAASFRKPNPAQ